LEICKELYGEENYMTVIAMRNLGKVYLKQKKFEESEELLLQAYEIQRREFTEIHP
jgi:hypothetical protein